LEGEWIVDLGPREEGKKDQSQDFTQLRKEDLKQGNRFLGGKIPGGEVLLLFCEARLVRRLGIPDKAQKTHPVLEMKRKGKSNVELV